LIFGLHRIHFAFALLDGFDPSAAAGLLFRDKFLVRLDAASRRSTSS
jgi:hypothetical protein